MSTRETDDLIQSIGRASVDLTRSKIKAEDARQNYKAAMEVMDESYKELMRLEDLLLKTIKGEGPVYKDGSG